MSSLSDHLSPNEIMYQQAHYSENRGYVVISVTSILFILAFASVVLRFIARKVKRVEYELEDYLIVIALILAAGMWSEALLAVKYGAGQHILKVIEKYGIQNLVATLKILFALQITYNLTHLALKISILLLYRRVLFGIAWFKRAWYILLIYIILNVVTSLASVIAQCRPIQFFWEEPLGAHGHCVNQKASQIANCITTSVADLMLWLLPLPIWWTLRIPAKQKVLLCGLFALGFVATVASVIRVWYLATSISGTKDLTYVEVNPYIWSLVEVDLGIICACIPTIKPLFMRKNRHPGLRANKQSSFDTEHRSGEILDKSSGSQPGAGYPKRPSETDVELDAITSKPV